MDNTSQCNLLGVKRIGLGCMGVSYVSGGGKGRFRDGGVVSIRGKMGRFFVW